MKTKNGIWIFSLLVLGVLVIFSTGCGNNDPVPPVPPVLTTSNASSIGQTSAISGGNVTSDGGAAVTGRGICWSTGTSPTLGDSKTTDGAGKGNFASSITGLTANTTYHIRAYATNSVGTGYGNDLSFTTQPPPDTTRHVSDIDGNVYHIVTIGTQTWMVENLKVTKYNDGTTIPLITDNTVWSNLTTEGYCWYENDSPTNKDIYGGLYNWYALNTGKLCPSGWHVPSDAEWTTLTNYLGSDVAGGKIKETGITHWQSPNTGATNESGFAALPGGTRYYDGTFCCIGNNGVWWSSSEDSPDYAWNRFLGYSSAGPIARTSESKSRGFSVRCIKD